MAQHVPISFPSPGDEVDGGLIFVSDHNHNKALMLIAMLVKLVLVVVLVTMMVNMVVR